MNVPLAVSVGAWVNRAELVAVTVTVPELLSSPVWDQFQVPSPWSIKAPCEAVIVSAVPAKAPLLVAGTFSGVVEATFVRATTVGATSVKATVNDKEETLIRALTAKRWTFVIGKDGKISQSVRRIVQERDKGKCQWRSEDGGICGSTYRVQFHHKQDRGKGGAGTPDNVIQLCAKHNFLAAEIAWGEEYMSQFRRQPSAAEGLQSQLEFNDTQ